MLGARFKLGRYGHSESPEDVKDQEAILSNPANTAEDNSNPVSLTGCSCSLGPKSICTIHGCSCAACRNSKHKDRCRWRKRHYKWMKSKGVSSKELIESPYFHGNDQVPRDHSCGVGSSRLPARESSLVEFLWHQNLKSQLLVADISQSMGLGGVRRDGLVPTIACTGKMWIFLWGRVLTANELATLMGFGDDRLSSVSWTSVPATQQRHMIGNSMSIHCVMAAIALALAHFTKGARNGGMSSSSTEIDSKRQRVERPAFDPVA